MDVQLLITFGVTLFSIVDAVGNIPFFIAATDGFTPSARRWIIERAILIASAVLVFFLLTGTLLLRLLNIRLSSFQIAAGIVLFIVGWDLLRARFSPTKTSEDEEAEAMSKEDIAVFPLAIPLLAGPGAITSCIVYGSQGSSPVMRAMMVGVVVIVMLTSFVILDAGARISARIGLTGMRVIRRVMGLLLTAIGVNFVLEGLRAALPYITG